MQEMGHMYSTDLNQMLDVQQIASWYNNGQPRNPRCLIKRVTINPVGTPIPKEGLLDYYTFDNVTNTIFPDLGGAYVFDRGSAINSPSSAPGSAARMPVYGATVFADGDSNMNGTLVG